MISYILPTHDRPDRVARSLTAIGELSGDDQSRLGGAEVIIVDNASESPASLPRELPNGLRVQTIRLACNQAAASRNVAARRARGDWLIMLDDDSYPLDTAFVEVLAEAPPNVAAIGADITLPDGRREAGGLPEVFVGCGVAIRRGPFLNVGGYDPAFHYYAEEYDLCAKLLLAGHRIVHDQRFRVRHEKVAAGRDLNVILSRLVRNNGWTAQRYAPDGWRAEQLRETIVRYGHIAHNESAQSGYLQGLRELFATIDRQPRRPMPRDVFDRFTGLAHVREALGRSAMLAASTRVAVVNEGKNAWVVRQALQELSVELVDDEGVADVLVVGTLSPGPMLDALEQRSIGPQPVIAPWSPRGTPVGGHLTQAASGSSPVVDR
ncbi:MAG: glycosyltransferase [Planctomycetes bacterium]|nr:glycosyltransferase [Planctomycetota bacterium]